MVRDYVTQDVESFATLTSAADSHPHAPTCSFDLMDVCLEVLWRPESQLGALQLVEECGMDRRVGFSQRC
ncbi:hypothetical protein DMA12_42485 [Amycolatopsis balhimycina DSM 5908]|uniref:Uncharacterized protein n=1 Tax=Amycolatopsis balhimycina DSM 5908 TaxID=1081091 RepID=A0A428VYH7_AMYBA|nr:hypothetical protein DMA12_42485 [Amycolatopsis balhimycina DSM 5908]